MTAYRERAQARGYRELIVGDEDPEVVAVLVVERRNGLGAQKACPMVTKYCVDLIPGSPFKLWPISKRIGPTGVA